MLYSQCLATRIVHQCVGGVQVAPAQPAPAASSPVVGEGELYLLESLDFSLSCGVGGLLPLIAVSFLSFDFRVTEFKVKLALFISIAFQQVQL